MRSLSRHGTDTGRHSRLSGFLRGDHDDTSIATPQYSAIEYIPLSLEDDEIRLLRIDFEHGNHVLTHVSMRVQQTQYTALSYPWGQTQSAFSEEIRVNGRGFRISMNLSDAIRDIMKSWESIYTDNVKALYLWVDQICIDQASLEERRQQVSFMGDIYERAEQVIIWLPVLKQLGIGDTLEHWTERRHNHGALMPNLGHDPSDVESQLKFYEHVAHTWRAWHHLQLIAQSPWWSRIWVYQEFMLGTRVWFLIDSSFIGWQALRDMMKAELPQMSYQDSVYRDAQTLERSMYTRMSDRLASLQVARAPAMTYENQRIAEKTQEHRRIVERHHRAMLDAEERLKERKSKLADLKEPDPVSKEPPPCQCDYIGEDGQCITCPDLPFYHEKLLECAFPDDDSALRLFCMPPIWLFSSVFSVLWFVGVLLIHVLLFFWQVLFYVFRPLVRCFIRCTIDRHAEKRFNAADSKYRSQKADIERGITASEQQASNERATYEALRNVALPQPVPVAAPVPKPDDREPSLSRIKAILSSMAASKEVGSRVKEQAWPRVEFMLDSKYDWSTSQLDTVGHRGRSLRSNQTTSKAEDYNNYVSLSWLLPHAQRCSCTDPRDKIYGFLGLIDPAAYGINADYSESNTIIHTWTSAAKSIITAEQNLHVLTLVTQCRPPGVTDNHLPSWVPEWDLTPNQRLEHEQFLRGIGISLDLDGCMASKLVESVVSFEDDQYGNPDRVLKARAVRVDVLHRIEKDNLFEPWRVFTGAARSGLRIATRNSARPGDEVWILLGLQVPIALTRPSRRDQHYSILGLAALSEGDQASSIMTGSIMEAVDAGEVQTEDIYII